MAAKAGSSRSIWLPVAAVLGCIAAWAVGGVLTRPNLDWFATLNRPSFAPPNSTFPIIWPILYATMAVSAWIAWKSPGSEKDRRTAFAWFFIQLLIGVLWSYAFFFMHSPPFGLAVILVLLVAIVITIVYFDRLSRIAAVLLVPYLLWVCFAAGLNAAFWMLNS